jgi:hypothetical protein
MFSGEIFEHSYRINLSEFRREEYIDIIEKEFIAFKVA